MIRSREVFLGPITSQYIYSSWSSVNFICSENPFLFAFSANKKIETKSGTLANRTDDVNSSIEKMP